VHSRTPGIVHTGTGLDGSIFTGESKYAGKIVTIQTRVCGTLTISLWGFLHKASESHVALRVHFEEKASALIQPQGIHQSKCHIDGDNLRPSGADAMDAIRIGTILWAGMRIQHDNFHRQTGISEFDAFDSEFTIQSNGG
jgi:hypothetical protein